MASPVWTWYLQGTMDTEIAAADKLVFSDGTFGNSILVGSFNGGTHVGGGTAQTDKSMSNNPKNTKYVSHMTTDMVDIGGGSINLSTLMTDGSDAPLKVKFAYTPANVTIMTAEFFSHSSMTGTAPPNVTFYASEAGPALGVVDSSWTAAEGGTHLTLNDRASGAMTHYFHIALSASPDTVGVKQGTGGTAGNFNMTLKLRYT